MAIKELIISSSFTFKKISPSMRPNNHLKYHHSKNSDAISPSPFFIFSICENNQIA
jgi:hypothetical protein